MIKNCSEPASKHIGNYEVIRALTIKTKVKETVIPPNTLSDDV